MGVGPGAGVGVELGLGVGVGVAAGSTGIATLSTPEVGAVGAAEGWVGSSSVIV